MLKEITQLVDLKSSIKELVFQGYQILYMLVLLFIKNVIILSLGKKKKLILDWIQRIIIIMQQNVLSDNIVYDRNH